MYIEPNYGPEGRKYLEPKLTPNDVEGMGNLKKALDATEKPEPRVMELFTIGIFSENTDCLFYVHEGRLTQSNATRYATEKLAREALDTLLSSTNIGITPKAAVKLQVIKLQPKLIG